MKLQLQRLSDMPNQFGNYSYQPIGETASLSGLVNTPAGLRLYSPNKLGASVLTTFEVEANVTKRNIGGIERTFYNLPNPNMAQDVLVRESINENMRLARQYGIESDFKAGLAERLAANVVLPTTKNTKQPVSQSNAKPAVVEERPAETSAPVTTPANTEEEPANMEETTTS